jgi:hypothetical protein
MFDNTTKVETFVREYEVESRGATFSLELSLGAGVHPGVALAGTFLRDAVPSPRVRRDGGVSATGEAISHELLGPSIDIYPFYRGGFHVGVAVGYASLGIEDPVRKVDARSHGIGVAPHVGYGWRVGKEWTIGFVGRVRHSRLGADVDDGLPTGIQHDAVTTATVQLSATLF